ncbi:hypothetical protein AB0N04_36975, partial [Kitasatospora sp. NPDC051702]
MSRSRTDRSPVRRVLAVCALTGGALLTAVTGGQAWADGSGAAPAPAAKPATAQEAGSGTGAAPAPAAKPAAVQDAKPSAGSGAVPTATPSPLPPRAAQPSAAPAVVGRESATPSPAPKPAEGGGQPQVKDVPKGAAQAGDGSTATDHSGLALAGGGARPTYGRIPTAGVLPNAPSFDTLGVFTADLAG